MIDLFCILDLDFKLAFCILIFDEQITLAERT
jgi:hypothetical protein